MLDDLEFAAQIGLQQVRIDVPWARCQPREASLAEGEFETLIDLAVAARAAGLAPWFRLLQVDVPRWFDNEGGFTDDRAAGKWWPRWVEAVAERLGTVAAGWVPFEAPFAIANRLQPTDARRHGDVTHALVVAWRDAWRVLGGAGGPPVATSIDVAVERPTDPSEAALQEARRRDHLRWHTWLGGLHDGIVRIPGRADRPLDDLAGACDIVGLAVRTGVEAALYRAAELAPPRPLAVTYRPTGSTDTEQADATATMWREVRRAAGDLRIVAVTAATLCDTATHAGIATADRRVKDSGEAFLTG